MERSCTVESVTALTNASRAASDEAAPTESAAIDAAPQRLSWRWWGLDWSRHTPWELESGVIVDTVPFDEALPFIQEHYAAIFEQTPDGARFLQEPMTEAKVRFYRESDVFRFRDGSRMVGVFICNPSDWSTYYMRTAGFLQAYQSQGLLTGCIRRMFGPLAAAGVARMEGDVAPSTFPNLRAMLRIGCNISGYLNTDRWGAVARFTKFLQNESEDVFLDQFCSGVIYQRRNRENYGDGSE